MLEASFRVEGDHPLVRTASKVPQTTVHVPTVTLSDPDTELSFVASASSKIAEALRSEVHRSGCSLDDVRTESSGHVVQGTLRCGGDGSGCLSCSGDLRRLADAVCDRTVIDSIRIDADGATVRALLLDPTTKDEVRTRLDDASLEAMCVVATSVTPAGPDPRTGALGKQGNLLETLGTAIRMGYYRSPRNCTMQDIADVLGITKSAVYHRMNKVERVAVGRLYEEMTHGAGDPPHRPDANVPHVE